MPFESEHKLVVESMGPGASWLGFKSQHSPLVSPLNELTWHLHVSVSSFVKWEGRGGEGEEEKDHMVLGCCEV